MNPQGTSFIPQRPIQSQVKKKSIRKIYVLTYVSYVLFFGTMLAAIGVFFYGSYLTVQLKSAQDRLVAEESQFNQNEITSIRVLNDQIVTVTERMNMHLSLLPIFSALEQNVSQSLRLKSLEYVRENDAPPKVTIEGTANIVGSILFQRELFADNPLFEQAQFTEVDIASAPKDDEDGSALDEVVTVVTFDMAAVMPIELLRYTPSSVRDSIPESLESDAMGSSTQEFDQNEAAVELLSEEEISS